MNTSNSAESMGKLLRVSFGVVILLAGLDKLLGINFITDWAQYLSPMAAAVIPFSGAVFVKVVGVIEVVVALLIFTRFAGTALYIASAWLVLIALNLVAMGGFLDVAVRDLLLAVAAYAAGRLTLSTEASTS